MYPPSLFDTLTRLLPCFEQQCSCRVVSSAFKARPITVQAIDAAGQDAPTTDAIRRGHAAVSNRVAAPLSAASKWRDARSK